MQEVSRVQFDQVYARLQVQFDHTLGESFYNDQLPAVVSELIDQGLAVESQGAKVVFFQGIPELEDHPALILKKDGGIL